MLDMLPENPPAALGVRDVEVWNIYWGQLERRIASVFARSDALVRAMSYLAGLLSPAERKNSWQLAEIMGAPNPYGFQHLLGRADWQPDTLRDLLRTYVTDYLADPDAIGVIDETGFLKKGTHSAGVARQYSGTAGRIENCQMGVFLAYASRHGQTLLDRELYLPAAWTSERKRCDRAGIPEDRVFATKPALAQQMLDRTFAAGVVLAWVTGDSVYGNDRVLRTWLEERAQAYVLAVAVSEMVWVTAVRQSIKTLLNTVSTTEWVRLSAGAGSKGPRIYDWQRLELSEPPSPPGWQRWLLLRRSISDPSDVTAYLVFARTGSSLVSQVQVAGMRWTVEESIQTAKGEVGLDQYEVRRWTGWYRHITLAMWAQAFLAVIRTEEGGEAAAKKGAVNRSDMHSLAAFKAHRTSQSG
jgi:SRSO17 transposase